MTGPIAATAPPGDPSHGYPFIASHLDLAQQGYVDEEYFIEGTANRYNTPSGQTGSIIDSGHPYKTRIVVRRPASMNRFNGTIVVEWINVTNGLVMETPGSRSTNTCCAAATPGLASRRNGWG